MYSWITKNVRDCVEVLGARTTTGPLLDAVLSLRCPSRFRALDRVEQRRLVANVRNRLGREAHRVAEEG